MPHPTEAPAPAHLQGLQDFVDRVTATWPTAFVVFRRIEVDRPVEEDAAWPYRCGIYLPPTAQSPGGSLPIEQFGATPQEALEKARSVFEAYTHIWKAESATSTIE